MCQQLITGKYLCGLNNEHLVSSYNGTSFRSKKERSSDLYHDMDKPWKPDTQGKQPEAKDHIFCISTICNVQKWQINRDREIDGCLSLERRAGTGGKESP